MADYGERERNQAEDLVREMLSYRAESVSAPPGLSIADMQRDANELLYDIDIAMESGLGKLPALRIEEDWVPAALSLLGIGQLPRAAFSRRRRPIYYRELEEARILADDFHTRSDVNFIDADEARETFSRRARDFLAQRIWAAGDGGGDSSMSRSLRLPPHIGAPPTNVSGCTFTVTTASSGLRVFWSGAYFVTGNHFGSPTSPVSAPLQAGTYIFGVDGGAYGSQIAWDHNAVCSLPGQPSVFLNF